MKLAIAWRNLWRHPRRTILILAAVVVGVWSMLFYSAFIRGLAEQMVRQNVSSLTGHLQVQAPGFFENPVLENLLQDPAPVRQALQRDLPAGARWTERLRINAVARSPHGAFGATLVGIDPAQEQGLSFLPDAIVQGELLPAGATDGIVVGAAVLDRLEARLGHRLVIDAQNAGGDITSRAFTIVGVFRAELESTEKQFMFCRRETLQDMLGLGGVVSEFSVLLPDADAVPAVAERLRVALPAAQFRVLTWRELVPFVGAYLDSMNVFSLIWNIIVFVAMGFGLVNTILMSVFERVREIGLVRALGVTPLGVVLGVVLETAMLLAFGLVLAFAIGWVSLGAMHGTGLDFSAFARGSEYFGMARVVYPRAAAGDYLNAGATVIVLGLIISLYPAVKAARITPVQAMSHV